MAASVATTNGACFCEALPHDEQKVLLTVAGQEPILPNLVVRGNRELARMSVFNTINRTIVSGTERNRPAGRIRPLADNTYDLPLPDSVGALVRSGAKWSISLLVLRQFLAIGALAVISRFLGPTDFGLIAMTMSLTGFLNLVADMGLTWATVQERELDRDRVNALFWLGAALGLTTWVAAVASAPLLARFYGRPELGPILAVMGMSLLLGGLSAQPVALLKRRIRQKAFSAIQTVASFAGAMVGIGMAVGGMGYWALVGQSLATPLLLLVLAIHQTAFFPGRPALSSGILPLLKFGGLVGICNLVTYFQCSLDTILIGYYGGAAEVGFYSRAYFLRSIPAVYAAITLTDIMVPAFAALRADAERLGAAYRKTVQAVAFVGCPIGVFLGVAAPEIVRIVYGKGWEPVVPILYWLAIPGIVLPVYTTMGWLYLAAGKPREMLIQAVVATALAGIAFFLGCAVGTAWRGLRCRALFTIPLPWASLYLAHRAARIEFIPTLKAIRPIFLACLVAAAGSCAVGQIASSLGAPGTVRSSASRWRSSSSTWFQPSILSNPFPYRSSSGPHHYGPTQSENQRSSERLDSSGRNPYWPAFDESRQATLASDEHAVRLRRGIPRGRCFAVASRIASPAGVSELLAPVRLAHQASRRRFATSVAGRLLRGRHRRKRG